MISKEEQRLLADVENGFDVEAFLKTTLGQLLLERATSEALSAMDELKTMKPSSFMSAEQFTTKFLELQGVIERAENFELWMMELAVAGNNAKQILEEMENTD